QDDDVVLIRGAPVSRGPRLRAQHVGQANPGRSQDAGLDETPPREIQRLATFGTAEPGEVLSAHASLHSQNIRVVNRPPLADTSDSTFSLDCTTSGVSWTQK